MAGENESTLDMILPLKFVGWEAGESWRKRM
jgi:hypothetical protein